MARQDEISSTEKLLNLIRSKSDTDSDAPAISPAPSSTATFKPSFLNALSIKKKIVIGVDIGRQNLRLAKISQSAEKKQELLECVRVPYDPRMLKNSPRFYRFLKTTLDNFCGNSEKYEIWSAISSANVETRYLRIPKVPKKQIFNAVFWTYKKDIAFSDENDIFDYEVLGDILEEGVPKMEVMAYSAPKHEINELKNIFSQSGYPLTGISIVPFALQNLFRTQWVPDGKNICYLFVGSDWSRIAIFSNDNLILSRDIKAGIQSMIEALREETDHHQADRSAPPESSGDKAAFENFNKDYDIGEDSAQQLLFSFINNKIPPAVEGEVQSVNSERIFDLILPALDRVVRQVERTIRHYSLNFGDQNISKLILSGKISSNRYMIDYISEQLDVPVKTIDPFAAGTSISAGVVIPESESEREDFVPAVGMALSGNSFTPNFIFTYKDKEKLSLSIQVKRMVFGATLLFMAACVGFFLWQNRILEQKKSTVAQLEKQMEKYAPVVDQNLIVQMVTKAQHNIDTAKAYVSKYLPMAIISEISKITPSDILLLDITAELGALKGSSQAAETSKRPTKLLLIEGVIFGDRLTSEASLAGYMVKLKSSPMFSQPVIEQKDYKLFKDREVLRFTAQLKLEY